MNRTAFSLPAHSEYRTHRGLEVVRAVEQFTVVPTGWMI